MWNVSRRGGGVEYSIYHKVLLRGRPDAGGGEYRQEDGGK